MTTISPTRVSMYDFLYQDTQPMVPLLADTAKLSLPQAQLALSSSLQAIISALLAYQQSHQSSVVIKKLFNRNAVKELRKYNSMNFATIDATLYYRNEVAEAVFGSSARVIEACEYIATPIKATALQIQPLLTCLCVIVLRELAILVDYSKLDNDELDKWFELQPQFLSKQRFVVPLTIDSTIAKNTEHSTQDTHVLKEDLEHETEQADEVQATFKKDDLVDDGSLPDGLIKNNSKDSLLKEIALLTDSEHKVPYEPSAKAEALEIMPPVFDPYWYELMHFTPKPATADLQQSTPNYLKAIGRAHDNIQEGQHDDMLVFAQMSAITLPHQRWLLQLAKVSDIYLSRKRLRITSEPIEAPARPLVNLRFMDNSKSNDPTTTSEKPDKYDKPRPFWKDPALLITLLVIAVLGALALLKYQIKQSNNVLPATEAVIQHNRDEKRAQQDVAIVKIDEEPSTIEEL